MADVRTFRAANMAAALDVVRREMGAEAVILHTRQISKRRWLPWKTAEEEVEITAGLGMNVRRPAALGSPMGRRWRSHTTTTGNNTSFRSVSDSGRALDAPSGSHKRTTPDGDKLAVSLRQGQSKAPPRPPAAAAPDRRSRDAAVASKLESIEKMLANLGTSRHAGRAEQVPDELFHIYAELIDAEVEDQLARDLIFRLKEECTPEQRRDSRSAMTMLSGMVESETRTRGPIQVTPGQRKVVALVGATGVGKTTTIAKLAANFRLRENVKMGLVTVDTYRIAAVEQLRTYAEIIDLPMKVVTSPREMCRALDELTGLDLVLIDTAGRSPRDELQIHELKSLLAEAGVDEVHLVLSMTSSLKSLEATATKFAPANPTALIMTKLDEAAGLGTILSLSKTVPLPISYITTGQDVPDDIEPATASRIARLVLGEDRLND